MAKVANLPEGCQATQYIGVSGSTVVMRQPGVVRSGQIASVEYHTGVAVCGDRIIQVTDNDKKDVVRALGDLTAAMCLDCPRNTTPISLPPPR